VKQRLLIFCSEVDADLSKLRQVLAEWSDQHTLPELAVEPVDGPESLAQGGWLTLSLTVMGAGVELSKTGGQLEQLVQVSARALSGAVLGIFVGGASHARACLQSPGGFPRSSEGEVFHVVRQAAGWLEADTVQLLRYFSAGLRQARLGTHVELNEVQLSAEDKEVEATLDEDDRFVEAKLKQARELMQQYLSTRK